MGINIQNLVRPPKEVGQKLDRAVELVRAKDISLLKSEFKTEPLDVVGGLLRSVFVAPKGKKLVICDLSAIENRVLGFIARDETINEVFRKGLDPYLNFAAKMYKVPYESLIKINDKGEHKAKDAAAAEMRQNAKPAVLGAGYGLSGGEETKSKDGDKIFTGLMGYARNMGIELPKDLADLSVQTFRDTHKLVVRSWGELERAAMFVIRTGEPQQVGPVGFDLVEGVLRMILPSGRALHYLEPKIVDRPWYEGTKKTIEYWGIDQKSHKWQRIYTYGSKLLENADQAISRDLLVNGMFNAVAAGFSIVMHTHDELVCEQPVDSPLGIAKLRECMIAMPPWGDNHLLIDAAGFESLVYRKD